MKERVKMASINMATQMLTITVVLLFYCCCFCEGAWVKEMENQGVFQGDMILDPDEFEKGWNQTKTYASIKGGRWPGGKVPYVIESSIDPKGVTAIEAAIADYKKYTCIRFVKRTNERAFVSFYKGGGCSSPVGYRAGRVNRISLASGCWYKGIVMHEMGHTLGFYHEQSRPDRDEYVTILWQNINSKMRYNFNKQTTTNVDSLGTKYDYSSMMHYGPKAFSTNGRITIKTKDSSKQNLIGRRTGFSEIDIQQLKLMYSCGGTRPKPKPRPKPTKRPQPRPRPRPRPKPQGCVDKGRYCQSWSKRGYCRNSRYINYMKKNCCKSCGKASTGGTGGGTGGSGSGGSGACRDRDRNCRYQVARGFCRSSRYGAWMRKNCKKSCRRC